MHDWQSNHPVVTLIKYIEWNKITFVTHRLGKRADFFALVLKMCNRQTDGQTKALFTVLQTQSFQSWENEK
jgi:hypothetical protein